MKKIICTVTNDLTYDRRMHRICSTLQNNNFDVELVGRALFNSIEIKNNVYQQYRLKCWFNKGFLFYAEYNIRLFFYLLFTSFDIVCGCDLDTLPAALLAAKIKRKKVVYDAHEYFPQSPELIGRPFVRNFWNWIESITIPHVDIAYTVTNSIAEIFKKKYKIDCRLIQNKPFLKQEKLNNSNQAILLYQGAVNVGRGLNEMLLTMLKIENAEFWIAGDGDEMETIRQHIQELQLDKKVKLLGMKTPEELAQLTNRAYIGINLLENRGLSYYYSLGNKTFDYIQAGKPQIMIGFPEYIQLNNQYNIGIIVEELTIEKIENAIKTLLSDKYLYQTLQQNCLTARKELCWEKEQQKLIVIYNDI